MRARVRGDRRCCAARRGRGPQPATFPVARRARRASTIGADATARVRETYTLTAAARRGRLRAPRRPVLARSARSRRTIGDRAVAFDARAAARRGRRFARPASARPPDRSGASSTTVRTPAAMTRRSRSSSRRRRSSAIAGTRGAAVDDRRRVRRRRRTDAAARSTATPAAARGTPACSRCPRSSASACRRPRRRACDAAPAGTSGGLEWRFWIFVATMAIWVPLYLWWFGRRRAGEDD